MRYVYIVTRVVRGETPYLVSVPNLGVYASVVKAIDHWKSAVEDRKKCGCQVNIQEVSSYPEHYTHSVEVRRAYIIDPRDKTTEILVIEKWPLNPREKIKK